MAVPHARIHHLLHRDESPCVPQYRCGRIRRWISARTASIRCSIWREIGAWSVIQRVNRSAAGRNGVHPQVRHALSPARSCLCCREGFYTAFFYAIARKKGRQRFSGFGESVLARPLKFKEGANFGAKTRVDACNSRVLLFLIHNTWCVETLTAVLPGAGPDTCMHVLNTHVALPQAAGTPNTAGTMQLRPILERRKWESACSAKCTMQLHLMLGLDVR